MLRALSVPCPLDVPTGRTLRDRVNDPACKWFFDKSVWQKLFRMYDSSNLNGLVLVYDNPFPALVDSQTQLDTADSDDESLAYSSSLHRWILENAAAYQVAVYLKFTLDSGVDETRLCGCLRRVLESYPEFSGIVVSVNRAWDTLQNVVAVMDAVRPDAALCISPEDWPDKSAPSLPERRHGRDVLYFVPYTDKYLVDAKPDSRFRSWVELVGAENVVADLPVANFQPWTSFSYDTTEEILENLAQSGVRGFNLWPLSASDFPRTSDNAFAYQWQRDMVWYTVWGGKDIERVLADRHPKWLERNRRLIPGFQAGSRALELVNLYLNRPGRASLVAALSAVVNEDSLKLLSVRDILGQIEPDGETSWWEEITGDRAVSPAAYIAEGTPDEAYGPDELIEELGDLSEQAVAAAEKGMRNASGEKELPILARDAACMGNLAAFYALRIGASLALGRGENDQSVEIMRLAIERYRRIVEVDASHRKAFRLSTTSGTPPPNPPRNGGGRCGTRLHSFGSVLNALEAELTDALNGDFGSGAHYEIEEIVAQHD